MKRFEFRLDSVLRYRSSQLQLERAKLTQMLGEETRLKNSLEALIAQRRDSVAGLQNAQAFEALELRSLSAYLVNAAAQETFLNQQIKGRQNQIAAQRTQVIEAERQVKLLEKLREKRFTEWQHALNKEIDAAAEESWLCAHGQS